MSQNVLSQKMVHFPVGLPTSEAVADLNGTNSVYARNKKSYVVGAAMTGAGTLNLATSYVAADQDGITRSITRAEGYELVIQITGTGAQTLTLGTGFGAGQTVAAINGTKIFKFEYINGAFWLV